MDFESRTVTGIVGWVSDSAALPTVIPFKRGLDWCTGERTSGTLLRASVRSESSPASRPVVGYAGSCR
jgi:hypothetical protein